MDNANQNNKKYIYKICIQDNNLVINKYLIIYQAYDSCYEEEIAYYVDEDSYNDFSKNGLGSDSLSDISVDSIYSLEKVKKSYLNTPNYLNIPNYYVDNWRGEFCCDTNEEEIKTAFSEWKEIRERNNEQEKLKKEEELKTQKAISKQKMLNQLNKNGDDIIKLGFKIDNNINDTDIVEIATELINRLKEENEKLLSELKNF